MNDKLRNRRAAAQMTQEDVARAARVPIRMYQSYEYGEREPRVTTAIRIAEALHCEPKDIFEKNQQGG